MIQKIVRLISGLECLKVSSKTIRVLTRESYQVSNPKIRSSNVKIIEIDLISYVNDRLYNLTTSFARSLELAIAKFKLSIF